MYCLVLGTAQLILAGVYSIKQAWLPFCVCLPLPLITCAFSTYLQRIYGPRLDVLPLQQSARADRHSKDVRGFLAERMAQRARGPRATPKVRLRPSALPKCASSLRDELRHLRPSELLHMRSPLRAKPPGQRGTANKRRSAAPAEMLAAYGALQEAPPPPSPVSPVSPGTLQPCLPYASSCSIDPEESAPRRNTVLASLAEVSNEGTSAGGGVRINVVDVHVAEPSAWLRDEAARDAAQPQAAALASTAAPAAGAPAAGAPVAGAPAGAPAAAVSAVGRLARPRRGTVVDLKHGTTALEGAADDASLAVLFGDMFVQPEMRPPAGLAGKDLVQSLSKAVVPLRRSRSLVLVNNL